MSRKGNKLLTIPSSVSITINTDHVLVKGPKGELKVAYPKDLIKVENVNNQIKVSRTNELKQTRMFHGTVNSNINNAIIGVNEGYKKVLKIVGVGYKAMVSGTKLQLNIGFSHPVIFEIPKTLSVKCNTPTEIEITGFDKILVGEFTANVRKVREPEPYNGKGIMYADERIVRKVGKTAEGSGKK